MIAGRYAKCDPYLRYTLSPLRRWLRRAPAVGSGRPRCERFFRAGGAE